MVAAPRRLVRQKPPSSIFPAAMPKAKHDPTMVAEVRARAGDVCEYCQYPQMICRPTFHCDHCIPESAGGATELQNLAWSCPTCNGHKRAHSTGIDPLQGSEVLLFNPRRDRWDAHFRWSADGCRIDGQTPIGRATVERLRLNSDRWSGIRKIMAMLGMHPAIQ